MSKLDKTPIEIIPIPPRGEFVEVTDRTVTICKIVSADEAQSLIDDWGCDYCRNDGKLTDNSTCPKCDAQFDE